jgi:hypothetical protein
VHGGRGATDLRHASVPHQHLPPGRDGSRALLGAEDALPLGGGFCGCGGELLGFESSLCHFDVCRVRLVGGGVDVCPGGAQMKKIGEVPLAWLWPVRATWERASSNLQPLPYVFTS